MALKGETEDVVASLAIERDWTRPPQPKKGAGLRLKDVGSWQTPDDRQLPRSLVAEGVHAGKCV